ncbi:MAG TPA: hypothetical protein DCP26_07685 [Brevundimonas sp.]|nr:hypothetical protein [Brevundimonas sp.]
MTPKERPILFSGPMVRALLDGRKTQTRRVVKPMPNWAEKFPICKPEWMAAGHQIWWWDGQHDRVGVAQDCPYGQPGDRLWVRESGLEQMRAPLFKLFAHDAGPNTFWTDSDGGRYGASYSEAIGREGLLRSGGWKVRPSIHMPRWACRLVLEITDVRVERLQAISEADALAEGIARFEGERFFHWEPNPEPRHPRFNGVTPEAGFQFLWETINGDESWEANPWVWAVSFRVVEKGGAN